VPMPAPCSPLDLKHCTRTTKKPVRENNPEKCHKLIFFYIKFERIRNHR
jgi:hypothetical protein